MLTVIGCGNPNRTDDGVGVVVSQRLIERLRRHPLPAVQAFDCGTAGMDVMYRARGSDSLILIDACLSGGEPGAIYEVPGEALETSKEPSYSLHDFRWDHALAAGRKIYGAHFPADVRVWLIEAQSTALGLSLTPPVAASADRVFSRVLDRIAAYTSHQDDSGPPSDNPHGP